MKLCHKDCFNTLIFGEKEKHCKQKKISPSSNNLTHPSHRNVCQDGEKSYKLEDKVDCITINSISKEVY